jgi:hypothetical protein
MQKAYDNTFSPANIAKTILDKFKGFNPFTLLKHSFWYCFFSWMLHSAKTTPWIREWASSGTFKKLKRGRCGERST